MHADGLIKNQEIYNIFDTERFLNRPPLVSVSNTSGLAGIAYWIDTFYHLNGDKKMDKNDPTVIYLKDEIDKEYAEGRVTVMTDAELVSLINEAKKKFNVDLPDVVVETDHD